LVDGLFFAHLRSTALLTLGGGAALVGLGVLLIATGPLPGGCGCFAQPTDQEVWGILAWLVALLVIGVKGCTLRLPDARRSPSWQEEYLYKQHLRRKELAQQRRRERRE